MKGDDGKVDKQTDEQKYFSGFDIRLGYF